MKNTYNQFYFTKTEYVKINNQIIDAIKKEDIKIVKNLKHPILPYPKEADIEDVEIKKIKSLFNKNTIDN